MGAMAETRAGYGDNTSRLDGKSDPRSAGWPGCQGFLASARAGNIPDHALTAAEVRKRWPQLAPSDALAAGLEVEAGLLFPELSIATFLTEAERAGAVLRFDERVNRWSKHGDRMRVYTSRETLEGGSLLLAAGARNTSLLGILGDRLSPKRVPVHWVAPPSEKAFELGNFPVNFWQLPAFEIEGIEQYAELYSLPVIGSGGRVKVAAHNNLSDCDPEATVRPVTTEEVADIRSFLRNFIPALANCAIDSDVCLYTQTPDGEFLLGALPGFDNVFTAALAGHGFKFAPVLGEVLADLIAGTERHLTCPNFLPLERSKPLLSEVPSGTSKMFKPIQTCYVFFMKMPKLEIRPKSPILYESFSG